MGSGDGVKWDIDVEAKADSARTTDQILERMEKHLQRIDGWAMGVAGHLGTMHEKGKEAGESTKSMFGEIFKAELAKDVLEKVVDKVMDIGREALKSAAAAERMNRVIDNASGGKAEGKENREWLEKFAKTGEQSEREGESAFVGMKRVGAGDREAKVALLAAADIAAVSENKGEAFSSAMSAFERLQRTGKVSNRTLAPLGLGEKDFAQLEEFQGMSKKQISAMMEKGEVTQNQLMRLIMAHTGESAIGEKGAQNVDLLQTKFEKLQELPERFFKRLGDTKAVGILAHALDGILTKLDPDSPMGLKIFGALEKATTAIASALDGIDFDGIADTITDDVIPAFESLISMVKPFLEFVEREMRGLHELHDMLVGPTPKNAAVEGFHSKFKRGEEDPDHPSFLDKDQPTHPFKENAPDPGVGPQSNKADAYDAYVAGQKLGKSTDQGFADGMGSGGAEDATEASMKGVEHKARKVLKTHSPSVVFEDIGAMTAAGFIDGIDGARAGIGRAVDRGYDVAPSAAAGGGGRGFGGGGVVQLSLTLHTTINMGDTRHGAEQGRRAADAYNPQIRAQIISVLEQMAIEAGAG